MTTQEIVNSLKGEYYVISPYHKNRKKLPFTITGMIYSQDYPIHVNTVEYRGWDKSNVSTGYTIETIMQFIEDKTIIKY